MHHSTVHLPQPPWLLYRLCKLRQNVAFWLLVVWAACEALDGFTRASGASPSHFPGRLVSSRPAGINKDRSRTSTIVRYHHSQAEVCRSAARWASSADRKLKHSTHSYDAVAV